MNAKAIVLAELAKTDPEIDVYEDNGKTYVIFPIDDEAAAAIALANLGFTIVPKGEAA